MDVEPSLLAEPDAEDADSLVSSNEPDDLANEQTWPTEEEISGSVRFTGADDTIPDAKTGTTPKVVRRVPKGTSEYQAAWIVDESDEEDEEGDEEAGDEAVMDEVEEEEEMVDLAEDTEMATDGRKSVAFEDFEDLDMEEEDRQYVNISPLLFQLIHHSLDYKNGEIANGKKKRIYSFRMK